MDEARQCDRLLVMSAGRIILRGTPEEIIGGRRVVQVDGSDWSEVFTALDSRGSPALAGTSVRVLTDDTTPVRRALDEAGVVAELSERAATLEEGHGVGGARGRWRAPFAAPMVTGCFAGGLAMATPRAVATRSASGSGWSRWIRGGRRLCAAPWRAATSTPGSSLAPLPGRPGNAWRASPTPSTPRSRG
ncbi:MAG: hypothetical protein R2716_08395 [Microthrixaceae bacterium]